MVKNQKKDILDINVQVSIAYGVALVAFLLLFLIYLFFIRGR